ncbi:uncharacterized protein DUF4124 [Thiogranum longum]|uniref:Uncharacterized protein DUF4124 n=1 Tax=Thiogranum longum TaxID=1537524 RepID=A0A4R1HAG2_9GAMM|nr:DUF4124 domain-containing protein [Thiogranum longum]TCK17120.1 uncharacterized protein DUF4124 [Thiogranum longum]
MKMLTRIKKFSTIGLCAIVALSVVPAQAAKLKKWVDENGQVQYGDHIPPQYARKSSQTLNNQGVIVQTRAAAKTPQQIAEEERLAELKAEQELKRQEQARKDRILLDTFTNEDEMILTRDGKIEAIEAIIRVTNGRIQKMRQRLATQKKRAAVLERSGKPVPESIAQQINEARDQIRHNIEYIENRRVAQQTIRDKYELDIRRFRELQAARQDESLETAGK